VLSAVDISVPATLKPSDVSEAVLSVDAQSVFASLTTSYVDLTGIRFALDNPTSGFDTGLWDELIVAEDSASSQVFNGGNMLEAASATNSESSVGAATVLASEAVTAAEAVGGSNMPSGSTAEAGSATDASNNVTFALGSSTESLQHRPRRKQQQQLRHMMGQLR
jgi:hypothetical protein